jgi:NitT/TauT family transport system ATP-binding protein
MESIAEFDHVTFSFDRAISIIDAFSWKIPRQKTIAVVGLSGCGKTTFLRLLCQTLVPTNGRVTLDPDVDPAYGGSFGLVQQEDGLYPWRTVFSNLKCSAVSLNHAKAEAQLFRFGLPASTLVQYPATLSLGMRKRVEIIRACLGDKRLVLADEPFSFLDEQSKRIAKESLMAAIKTQAGTLVIVSHDLPEMTAMADIFVLFPRDKSGRLIILENPVIGVSVSDKTVGEFRIQLAQMIGAA